MFLSIKIPMTPAIEMYIFIIRSNTALPPPLEVDSVAIPENFHISDNNSEIVKWVVIEQFEPAISNQSKKFSDELFGTSAIDDEKQNSAHNQIGYQEKD